MDGGSMADLPPNRWPMASDAGIELHRLYRIAEAKPHIRMGRLEQDYYLPTEMVVREPKVVCPQQGRIYGTPYYLPSPKGDGYYPWVVCAEVYQDEGDDGHTDMRLDGFVFFSNETLRTMREYAEIRKPMKYGRPATMHTLIQQLASDGNLDER